MLPYVEIAGKSISTYMLLAGAGMLSAFPLFSILLIKKNVFDSYIRIVLLSILGMIIGARLFGIAVNLFNIVAMETVINISELLQTSGIVYYGGLFGLLGSMYILCKVRRRDFAVISDEIALAIPLFHFWGRFGCFFAGCCYGILYNGFASILYNNGEDIVCRFPVQIAEAILELMIFILFCWCYFGDKKIAKGHLLDVYLFIYSIIRFGLEFLRGDSVRGVYGIFSFGQYCSLLILIAMFIKKVLEKRKAHLILNLEGINEN